MPWRLIQFIFFFAIFLMFIVFNLEHKCDISFGFAVIRDAPVYLTTFASFMLGMLFALPFIFGYRSRKKKAEKAQGKGLLSKMTNIREEKSEDSGLSDKSQYGID